MPKSAPTFLRFSLIWSHPLYPGETGRPDPELWPFPSRIRQTRPRAPRYITSRMRERSFDIFFGVPGADPLWRESVQGLMQARERMRQIATQTPGPYFIFSVDSQSILAQVDTAAKPPEKSGGDA